VNVTLCDGVILVGEAEHAMFTGMSTVYVIDALLAMLFESAAWVAVIVCASEISDVGGCDADGAGCVPADKPGAAGVAVTMPLAFGVPDPSAVDVVVSVIVVVPVVTAAPPAVTVVFAVNVTDVPYPSGDAGFAVSVVVVATAAADAIDVCAKHARVSANRTLKRTVGLIHTEIDGTKAPFNERTREKLVAHEPVEGINPTNWFTDYRRLLEVLGSFVSAL
jgi:hypothetical protein